jgi:hypothetical protein
MATKRDLEQWAIERFGTTPIEYMMGVMVNPANTQAERVDAAKAAAPYIHPKLRQTEVREIPAEKTPEELEHDVAAILERYVRGTEDQLLVATDPRGQRDLIGSVE